LEIQELDKGAVHGKIMTREHEYDGDRGRVFLLGFCIGAGLICWLSVSKNEKKKRKERT
jgi:hypothetical protein